MKRALVVLALVACKAGNEPPPPAPAPSLPPPPPPIVKMTPEQLAVRTATLVDVPYATRLTETPCPIDFPKQGSSMIAVSADELLNGGLDKRGGKGKLQTIVVEELGGIGRIYVWDRDAAKFVCGGGFQGAAQKAAMKLTTVVPTEDTFPKPPAAMAARTGKRVKQVSSGENHTCVLVEDGSVRCFGQNDVGQANPFDRDHTMVAAPKATWGYGPIGDGRDCSGPPCDGLLPTEIPVP